MAPRARRATSALAVVAIVASATVRADDFSNWNLPAKAGIDLHAFVSQGGLISTANNYLAYTEKTGTVDFTEFALNATRDLGDQVRVGMQLFTSKIGPDGTYIPEFDWAYLDWHRFDWLNLRAGRIKVPYGLYNEETDYDPGHLSVLMPQSVYSLSLRDFLISATGAGATGYIDIKKGGALSYSLVAGSSLLTETTMLPAGTTIQIPLSFSARLIWETPVTGLRFAASLIDTHLNYTAEVPATGTSPAASVTGVLNGLAWVASAEYAIGHFRFSGEYSDWDLGNKDNVPGTSNYYEVQSRYYADGEYTFNAPVAVGAYYAGYFPNIRDLGGGPQNYQHDVALTVRWDVTNYLLVKLEGHFIHGTADVSPTLNEGVSPADLTMNWGLFAAKVTAYF